MGNERREAVFFDLDDTLYDQAAPFGYAVEQVIGAVPGVSATDLFETSRRYSQDIFAALRRDLHPTDEMYIRRMQLTLGHYGVEVSPATALELQRVYGTKSKDAMRLQPEIEEALAWCQAHARLGVGVVTNGREAAQRSKIEILGLGRWISPDHLFISDALGYAKPSPEIFRIACDAVGADPAQCLYVGDAFAIDVLGAHSVGMPVVWYNHRLRACPTDQFPPEYEVHTVRELCRLLERIV